MVRMRPLLSITMAEPSRSRPRLWAVRPFGLMKVFICTTPESSSASAGDWARATEAVTAAAANASSATRRAFRGPRAGTDLRRYRIRMNPLHQRKLANRKQQTRCLGVVTCDSGLYAPAGPRPPGRAPPHRILCRRSRRRLRAYTYGLFEGAANVGRLAVLPAEALQARL